MAGSIAPELNGVIFTVIAAVFYLVIRHQNLQRYRIRLEMIQKERIAAMEKGVPMPELPDYDDMAARRPAESLTTLLRVNPRWPLGVAAILILGGIGTTLALYLSQEPDHNRVWSMGIIPVSVGFGLLLHYRLTRSE